MPDVGYICIEHQHVQVHTDADGSWREVVVTTSGSVTELMEECGKQDRNIYHDKRRKVHLFKRQIFSTCGEQESREQGKIDRQHEIIGLEGEQRLERTTYLRDPHLANDLLLEKERT